MLINVTNSRLNLDLKHLDRKRASFCLFYVQPLIMLITLFIPYSVALATNQSSFFTHYVLGIDLGLSTTQNLGNSASFPLGYSTFTYHPKNTSLQPLRFGASLSKLITLSKYNALQIGLSYHYLTNMKVTGSLEQGISPPFLPFTYSHVINSSQLLAEAKWLHQWRDLFYPYVAAGIGAGFNNAKNYTTNVPEYLTITPYYTNHSTTSVSYSVGLGVDYAISKSLNIGAGYRFLDLGRVALGDGFIRNTPVTSPLTQANLYLNTLQVELNWFF